MGPTRSRTTRWDQGSAPGALLAALLPGLVPALLSILVATGARGSTPADSIDCISSAVARISATRVAEVIHLDGRLDESVWQGESVAPLVQNEPENGACPRLRTDWWIAYDDEALYVAARMWDAAPESIGCCLGRRDSRPESDWVFLNLDTFNDDRNGYSFSLNPSGSIADAVLYNDGWNDDSWDGIWDYGVRVDDDGWVAEIRIPLSQLRFPDRDEQVWGINFSRRVLRYQERDELFHKPRDGAGYMNRFPDLVGIHGVKPGRRVDVLTYAAGKAEFLQVDENDPFAESAALAGDAGADISWGLSNDLSLNATINPDFGQVEVDPAVVNLSDFETYFPEKRPFFVEDATTFQFGREGTNNNWNFNWMDPILFYSRRIGRSPTLSLGDNDFADEPSVTTIYGAGKLSGKVGDNTIGILSATTAEEKASLEYEGERSSQIVEPSSNYSVARLQRASADGHRGLGLLATNVHRNLADERSVDELVRNAYVLGIDGWTRLDEDGEWALKTYVAASRIEGSASAIDDIQRSSPHYLDRPGAGHTGYDPERTSLEGWTGRAMLNRESGTYRLNASAGIVSPGFEINDLGFQNRADAINASIATGFLWREPTDHFRSKGFDLATFRTWDYAGTPDHYGHGLFYYATLRNYWSVQGQFMYSPNRNGLRTTRGGPIMRLPEIASTFFYVNTDTRRSTFGDLWVSAWRIRDGSAEVEGGVDVTFRPRPSLRISVGPELSWRNDQADWVDAVEDSAMTATGGTRYLFGNITDRRFGLTTRVDWSFTPKLTLQTFVQPLFVAARYEDIKEFARPSSYDFNVYGRDNGSTIVYDEEEGEYRIDPDGPGGADEFTIDNPDFNYKSLKVNMVLRWEFRPGSTFFLVWTQNRTDDRNPGDFRLGRDARSLFGADGEDIVMFKVATWWDL